MALVSPFNLEIIHIFDYDRVSCLRCHSVPHSKCIAFWWFRSIEGIVALLTSLWENTLRKSLLDFASKIGRDPVVRKLRINNSLHIVSCDWVSDVSVCERVEDSETVTWSRLSERVGSLLKSRCRGSNGASNDWAPGAYSREEMSGWAKGKF